MTNSQFLTAFQKFLDDNTDPIKAEKEKKYLYSEQKHYGIYSGQWGPFYKKHGDFLKALDKKEALDLVKHLWVQPSWEERMMGVSILNMHQEKLDASDMPLIEKMMRESKGWAYLDSLIIPIMPILLEKDPTLYSYLKKWVVDNDFWVRRSALLAQLLFFRQKDKGDFELFFEFARAQLDETWIDKIYKDKLLNKRAKFFIRKAIGWVLRDMSIKNPNIVVRFLHQNKAKMSGLSFREGSRKLPENLRNRI
jgi:3-methyladenine DNA glycosylase AlkD